MLSENFIEIFEKYDEEKEKPLKNNELANKMDNEFNENFKNFIKEFVSSDYDYITKISHGSGEWVANPWAGVLYQKISASFNDGFYIIAHFDIAEKIIKIGLGHGVDKVDKELVDKRMEYMLDLLKNKYPDYANFELNEGFINIRTFKEDELNDGSLKKFFKNIIKDYECLIQDYIDFVFAEKPLDKDLRLEDDGRRIWIIQPGNSGIYDEAWDIFKKQSYVGMDCTSDDKTVDYSNFKNKYAIKLFLSEKIKFRSYIPFNIWKFVNVVKKGDLFVINKGKSKLAGIGVVTGDFISQIKNKEKNNFNLNDIRPVKWFYTPDNLEIEKNFFSTNDLELKSSIWNPLMFFLARTDEDLKSNVLTYVYDSFAESDVLTHHNEIYDEEQHLVRNVWKKIENNYNNGLEIAATVWDDLINREIRLHADGSTNIKSSIQGKTKFTDEEMDQVAMLLFETIKKLLDTDDIEEQKQILRDYCANKYSKGFRKTGRFSSILYNLGDSFYGINNKSKDTVELFSLILGDKLTLNLNLENYIETNEEYKKFLKDLKSAFDYDEIDISDFRTFDSFCHWACDKNLGNIAGKNADFLPFDLFVDIKDVLRKADQEIMSRGISEDDGEENEDEGIERLNLTPELLQSKLQGFKVSPNSIKRICASLNSGKHIILNGTPGTGKTELALKFSNASKENKFCDGFVLTTATSDWSTFDTIGGLMPNENGELYFNQGKFLEAISLNKWLIIDEINRADIDKAFGQLFTVLSGQNVELPYKRNGKSVKIVHWDENRCKYDDETATYFIGKNWRIIGTMNVDDKDSLFDLSYAFMRRFMFIEIDLPEDEEYLKLIQMWTRGLDDYYVESLEYLIGLVKYRKLGPAIFKDMIEYIKVRKEFDDEENDKLILCESIDSYIIPQLEGLRKSKLKDIKTFLNDWGLLEFLEEGIDELMPEY